MDSHPCRLGNSTHCRRIGRLIEQRPPYLSRNETYALCGYADFSSMGILAGGLSVVASERRSEVARYGMRLVATSTLSNLASVAIAGIVLSMHWRSPVEQPPGASLDVPPCAFL